MGTFFGKLFEHKHLLDFSVLNADMHSHLIPNIDDGSISVQETRNMITGLQAMGFKKFITTPHIMPEVFKNTTEIIENACVKLNEEIAADGEQQVIAAAEYYIDEQFANRVRSEERFLTFGENYILIEVNMMAKEKRLEEVLFELNLRGYKPVLAHVERYPFMYEGNSLNYYSGLMDADVLLQVNLRSFTGQYGEIQKKIARQLAEHNMINFLGTDIHHENQLPVIHQSLKDPYVQKLLANNTLMNKQL